MEDIERPHKMTLRLSDDEYRILDSKTVAMKAPSRSYVIRKLLVDAMLYEVDLREFRNIDTQLARIGNNLNQIAKRINETRSIYQTDIDEIKKEFKEICRLQEYMLSKLP